MKNKELKIKPNSFFKWAFFRKINIFLLLAILWYSKQKASYSFDFSDMGLGVHSGFVWPAFFITLGSCLLGFLVGAWIVWYYNYG